MGDRWTEVIAFLVALVNASFAKYESEANEKLPKQVIDEPYSIVGILMLFTESDGLICWYFPFLCAAAYAKHLSGLIMRSAHEVHLWNKSRSN